MIGVHETAYFVLMYPDHGNDGSGRADIPITVRLGRP